MCLIAKVSLWAVSGHLAFKGTQTSMKQAPLNMDFECHYDEWKPRTWTACLPMSFRRPCATKQIGLETTDSFGLSLRWGS